jgi:glycosyltransferase involved in cell wall biosynthesis
MTKNQRNNLPFSSGKEIVFLYRGGREERLTTALAGMCPTEFFYGAVELIRYGYNVCVVDINYETSSSDLGLIDKFFDLFFKHQFLPSRVYGPLLKKVWAERHRFCSANVIVATTPGIAFAVSILKLFFQFPARIIAIQLGLADYTFSSRRLFLNRFFLKRIKNIVYTELEKQLMLKKYDLHKDNTIVNQFGVDASFWCASSYDHNGYILAVGSDGKRDYDLLIRAAERIEKQFIIVTTKDIERRVPENVKILQGDWLKNRFTDTDIRDLYHNASIVVTPLIQTNQPSGQSVCLQAMSCERPVVLSAIQGLWSKEILHDNETVVLAAPGDLDELVEKIENLVSDKKRCIRIGESARKAVLKYATTEHWASQLHPLLEG